MDSTTQPIFTHFLEKLKQNKTQEEVSEILAALFQFQSEAVYEVLTQILTEEDLQAIDQITDDTKAEEEVIIRFQQRAGMSIQEFVDKLRDSVSSEYLKEKPQP